MTETSRISDQLRQIREEAGLSVRMLAARLGIPASTYANYETRAAALTIEMIVRAECIESGRGAMYRLTRRLALTTQYFRPWPHHDTSASHLRGIFLSKMYSF